MNADPRVIAKELFYFFILVNLPVLGNSVFAAELPCFTDSTYSRCFVFPNKQTVKIHESKQKFLPIASNQLSYGKYKIFLVSESLPSFLYELFSFDKRLVGLSARDQWSFHKFRYSKHLLNAHIQDSLSQERKYEWELHIVSPKNLAVELSDSEDLSHAIIFLHGDESGSLFGYDGKDLPLDTFSNIAPSIQSICVAACYLPSAIEKYEIRKGFLNTSQRFFIEAVNDEFDEFLVDNTPSLIKIVEEVIESRIHYHGDSPVSELVER